MKKWVSFSIILACFLVCSGSKSSRRVTVVATGYCPCEVCCGSHADGKTATGRDAKLPGLAIDPKIFKLGKARFDIPGYNRGSNNNGSWILADDTGGAIKGYRIDLRFKSHEEATKWGKKKIKVRVWE